MAVVLLAEDEILVRELIQEALEEQGFQVEPAGDGAEACDRLEAQRPDVLVTDINLGPGPNGFEVARRGRQLMPQLKVVYITGHAEHLGAHGVPGAVMTPKPFRPDRLVGVVTRMLEA